MLRMINVCCLLAVLTLSPLARADEARAPKALQFKMKDLGGKEVDLSRYQGKVLLVVNVASECGLTPQYEQLQALHAQYGKEGLAVLGFPCNQFGQQEPGTATEIQEFCQTQYGVKFDMFSKIDVNGEQACPLYKHLTALDIKPAGKGPISWNFEKFVIDRHGNVVARFSPRTKPDAEEVVSVLKQELAKK